MNFNILLALAGIICLIGLSMRLTAWFAQDVSPPSQSLSLAARVTAALQGLVKAVCSAKIFRLLMALFTDLIFQQRIAQKSSLRWLAHTLIFFGFIFLLLMHALESFVSVPLFNDYLSTLNPYLYLRNLFGIMVLVGICLAVYRRLSLRPKRLQSNQSDWLTLILVGGIVLSGMLLEGAQMSSYTIFQEMVDEYGAFDEEETLALETFWAAEHGLVSPNVTTPIEPEMVELGRETNEMSCIECHSANRSAFASFSLIGVTKPVSALVGDEQAVTSFYAAHLLFILVFLGWLPFSKMFHIISAPISLLINSIMGMQGDNRANVLNRQMIGLSACTHCGSCSLECSASMFFEFFDNTFILPSEKVQYLKKIAAGKEVDPDTLKRLQEGLYVCTSCDRCSKVCPSGINLRDLFVEARYRLLDQGKPEKSLLSHFSFPLALAQKFTGDHLKALKAVEAVFKKICASLGDLTGPMSVNRKKEFDNLSYQSCYSCQRCTNICPVVRNYDNPVETLDMLPHQLIFSLGIGNIDIAMGAQMIWSCSTCYLCQEHCPNQVELTDIFYSLKNKALNKMESGEQ